MEKIEIKIIDERLHEQRPSYATAGSAGLDLRACIDDTLTLEPREVSHIQAGIAIPLA